MNWSLNILQIIIMLQAFHILSFFLVMLVYWQFKSRNDMIKFVVNLEWNYISASCWYPSYYWNISFSCIICVINTCREWKKHVQCGIFISDSQVVHLLRSKKRIQGRLLWRHCAVSVNVLCIVSCTIDLMTYYAV